MKEKVKKIFETIKKYQENNIEFNEAIRNEFESLTKAEQEEISSLHSSYCAEQVYEAAKKDKRVAERVAKAIEFLKKEGKLK